jgi:GT2 family glycosyltransferase
MDVHMQIDSQLPLVSIVIPHHAGEEVLHNCLESIATHKSEYPIETIVVDNGSSDGSMGLALEQFPEVNVIRLPQNEGFAIACNRGIEKACGKYVVLLNDDAEVTEGWLEPMIQLLESDSSVGVCQPKILSSEHVHRFEYSGAAGGMIDVFGLPFSAGRLFDHVEGDQGQFDESTHVFWASGVAMFMRKSALDETGLLDELFVSYMEEIDLSWRFHLLGYKAIYVPQSVVYHKGGHTLERKSIPRMYYNHRNSLIMLVKNLGALNLFWIFPIRLILEVGILAGAGVRNRRRMLAQIMAYGYLLTHIPTILRERRRVQKLRRKPDSYILSRQYWGFVSLEYFLLGRKKVAELRNFEKMMERMRIPGEGQTAETPEKSNKTPAG